MDTKLLVVVTYSDDKSALDSIADGLMQIGIPAVHISKVDSWYRWKGERHNTMEYKLDVLCTHVLLVDVISLIRRNHNYEVPAITWSEVNTDDNTFSWATGLKF